jgi:NCS2 family nucleobase:cation symporter-2
VQFSHVFSYSGDNRALLGFFNAIELVMETGFAVTAFVSLFLNLILPEEEDDCDIPELTANDADAEADREERAEVQGGKTVTQTTNEPRKEA